VTIQAGMAGTPLPDGIDADTGRGLARRRSSVWAPRIVLLALSAVVLIGLSNAFGQTTTTSRASTGRADLIVTAPAALRGGLIFQVVFEVVAKRDIGNARLLLSEGWFSGFSVNSVVPQPSAQDSVDGRVVFGLGPIHAGDHKTVRMYFQVNPTTVAWMRTQDVELDDGTSRVASVHRTTTVYL
jgi:hypothetical protein